MHGTMLFLMILRAKFISNFYFISAKRSELRLA